MGVFATPDAASAGSPTRRATMLGAMSLLFFIASPFNRQSYGLPEQFQRENGVTAATKPDETLASNVIYNLRFPTKWVVYAVD